MCVGWLCLRMALSTEHSNVQKKKVFLNDRCKILDLNCEDDLVTSYNSSYSVGAKMVGRKLATVWCKKVTSENPYSTHTDLLDVRVAPTASGYSRVCWLSSHMQWNWVLIVQGFTFFWWMTRSSCYSTKLGVEPVVFFSCLLCYLRKGSFYLCTCKSLTSIAKHTVSRI